MGLGLCLRARCGRLGFERRVLGQGTVVYRRLHGVDDESVRQLAHLVPDFLDLPAAGQELLNQFVQLLGLLPLYVSITPRWIAGR
ncbi:hypothetical protein G039_0334295 [Pseudomonas aeruginosa VRFPA01]|nr:hypothetical protein G039_0334295 [Pseudomonas aeruginosa VRFPA01]